MNLLTKPAALLSTLAALAAPVSSARAQEPASAQPDVTTYGFDDDHVLGDTAQPLGEILHVRPRPKRESLVRARSSFVPELLSSVEAL